MDGLDLTFVDQAIERIGTGREKVLELALAIQQHYGYLPREALERVCEGTQITPASMAGVSTFYSQFRHRPAGRHIIRICTGTACHVKGSDRVFEAFQRHLDLSPDEDTDRERPTRLIGSPAKTAGVSSLSLLDVSGVMASHNRTDYTA